MTDTRRDGLAYDYEQRHVPLSCVAAPIFAPDGRVVAALAASAIDIDQIPALADAITWASRMATANLRSSMPGLSSSA
ncbi:IclR family transcriptional regulator C-terminal domain-containing protein [Nocardia sp. NPDC020380]|uniref:IclR family transcriptional regulator domain-containing protein n=1 Tax=Nocardia sp. NPDC020380 TaxID=3364309 RepID=UPI00378CBCFC